MTHWHETHERCEQRAIAAALQLSTDADLITWSRGDRTFSAARRLMWFSEQRLRDARADQAEHERVARELEVQSQWQAPREATAPELAQWAEWQTATAREAATYRASAAAAAHAARVARAELCALEAAWTPWGWTDDQALERAIALADEAERLTE